MATHLSLIYCFALFIHAHKQVHVCVRAILRWESSLVVRLLPFPTTLANFTHIQSTFSNKYMVCPYIYLKYRTFDAKITQLTFHYK